MPIDFTLSRMAARASVVAFSDGNPVDLAREATPGTIVGIAGSGVTLLLGLFLATRRPA